MVLFLSLFFFFFLFHRYVNFDKTKIQFELANGSPWLSKSNQIFFHQAKQNFFLEKFKNNYMIYLKKKKTRNIICPDTK